ncbi:MAG: hypothetical protein ACOYL3_06415 [Desulfuromonadaceae bacterium]
MTKKSKKMRPHGKVRVGDDIWNHTGDACASFYQGAITTVSGGIVDLVLSASRDVNANNTIDSVLSHILFMSQHGIKSEDGTHSVFQVDFLNTTHKLKIKSKIVYLEKEKKERVRIMLFDED